MSRWAALVADIDTYTAGALLDERPLCLPCLHGAGGLGVGEMARLLSTDRLRLLTVPDARSAGQVDCAQCARPLLLVG